jgi:hypothetical protein
MSTARARSGEMYSTLVRRSRPGGGVVVNPSIAARNAARVFPEPVGARSSVCRPSAIAFQPLVCASVGASNDPSNQACVAGEKAGTDTSLTRYPLPPTCGPGSVSDLGTMPHHVARSATIVILVLFVVATWPSPASAQVSGGEAALDQVVLRGDVVVPRGQVVGEIVVFSGSATVAGVARGDVVVLDGPITVAGQVGGDVIAVHGSVRLLATAQVAGTVRAGGDVRQTEGSQVNGGIQRGARFTLSGPLNVLGPLLASAAMAVSILLLALLLLLFAPRGVEGVAAAGRTSPFVSAGWGLLAMIALPLVSIAAGATILGLPLALSLLLAIGLLWLTGLAWATWIVGRALLGDPRSRWASLFTGWGVGAAIGLVPFVNVVWWTLGGVFGMGAMIVAVWRARSTREPTERQPAARRQRRERSGRHREGRITVPAEVISLPDTPLAED